MALERRKDPGEAWETVEAGLGVSITYKLPFAFDTPGIEDGIPIYTPADVAIIQQIRISVLEAFDGTTPQADVGTFQGVLQGFAGTSGYNAAAVLSHEDFDDGGVLLPGGYDGSGVNAGSSTLSQADAYSGPDGGFAVNGSPFTGTLLLVVSQDGLKGGAPVGGTQGSGIAYVTVAVPVDAPG